MNYGGIHKMIAVSIGKETKNLGIFGKYAANLPVCPIILF